MATTINGTTGIVTETGTGDVSVGDDLIFTGTGNRITGDFSNATESNRVGIQSSTTNGATALSLIPNGTSTFSGFILNNSSDVANSSQLYLQANGSSYAALLSGKTGTGAYLPIAMFTGGAERLRIDTSGNVGIGVTPNANYRLDVKSAGTTNGTRAINIVNSANTTVFTVFSDGSFNTGSAAGSPYNTTTGSAANLFVDSNGYLYRSTSSLKYKTDVNDATFGLADVLKLRPVTYKGKNDGDTVFGGLIAEEVHEAGLTEFVQYADDGSPDAIHYGNMVSLAFKAIQELKAELDSVKAELATFKGAA